MNSPSINPRRRELSSVRFGERLIEPRDGQAREIVEARRALIAELEQRRRTAAAAA